MVELRQAGDGLFGAVTEIAATDSTSGISSATCQGLGALRWQAAGRFALRPDESGLAKRMQNAHSTTATGTFLQKTEKFFCKH